VYKKSLQAYGLFVICAMFWGATFPITKSAIAEINLYAFVFLRFGLAALVMLPFVWKGFRRAFKRNLLTGLILGLLNTGTFVFEALSVHYTSVARAAFIAGANVALVPFLSRLFGAGVIRKIDLVAAACFLFGLYIFTDVHMNEKVDIGSIFAVFAAICIALSLVYIHRVTIRHTDLNDKMLTFFQIIFVTPIPFAAFLIGQHTPMHFNLNVIWSILFCAIFATAWPLYGQVKWQKHTSASVSALIFALEPVFAILIAALFYHAKLPTFELIGAAVMLASTMLPSVQHLLRFKKYPKL
jgi:drug/metabolite transporter (DMT)-like permease